MSDYNAFSIQWLLDTMSITQWNMCRITTCLWAFFDTTFVDMKIYKLRHLNVLYTNWFGWSFSPIVLFFLAKVRSSSQDDHMCRYAQNRAREWAITWHASLEAAFHTCDSLTKRISRVFAPPNQAYRVRLRCLTFRQGKKELSDFVQKLWTFLAAMQLHPLSEATPVTSFMKGLPSGVARRFFVSIVRLSKR